MNETGRREKTEESLVADRTLKIMTKNKTLMISSNQTTRTKEEICTKTTEMLMLKKLMRPTTAVKKKIQDKIRGCLVDNTSEKAAKSNMKAAENPE